jgi:hypothetical protein
VPSFPTEVVAPPAPPYKPDHGPIAMVIAVVFGAVAVSATAWLIGKANRR